MLMTYDILIMAKRDESFMKQLMEALSSDSDSEICTDIYRLTFHADKQTVIIGPKSDTSPFHMKIVPKEFKYQAVLHILDGNWDEIKPGDIMVV